MKTFVFFFQFLSFFAHFVITTLFSVITVTMVTDPRVHDNDVLTQYEGEEILLTCAVESKYSLEVLMTKYSFGWNFKGTVLANGYA